MSTSKDKGKRKRIEEPKNEAAKGPTQKKQNRCDNYFFRSKPEHVKKKCTKYHAMFLTLVCSEANLASVPRNTWWLDSGATTNISVSIKGCPRNQLILKDGSLLEMVNWWR